MNKETRLILEALQILLAENAVKYGDDTIAGEQTNKIGLEIEEYLNPKQEDKAYEQSLA